MNRPNCQQSCCRDKKKLQAIDFAIQETVLYLDAYPNCAQALAYYHQLVQMRNKLMEAYEQNCGPITMYGNTAANSWDWVKGPWPWEIEAN